MICNVVCDISSCILIYMLAMYLSLQYVRNLSFSLLHAGRRGKLVKSKASE